MSDKSIQEVIKSIEEYIEEEHLPPNLLNKLSDAKNLMVEDISRAQKREEYVIDYSKRQLVKNTLTGILVQIVLRNAQNVLPVLHDYLLLVHNWNKIARDKDINDLIEANRTIISFYRNVATLSDTYMKLYDEVEISRNFNPPSYGMKKDFLKSLEDKFGENL